MKIIIADDHSVVRKGLKFILEQEFENLRLFEVDSGDELLGFINENSVKKFDLVILDIAMPGKNVIDTLRSLKSMHPELPILIFSMNPERAFAVRMLKAGATGYLNKDCSHAELIDAIKKLVSGRGYISASLSELLAAELRDGSITPSHEKLSDREFQVLELIASGLTLEEISEKLFLSKNSNSHYQS